MVNIEIDGVKLEAEPGSMIIEAADEAGISIPRFCYHKKLSVAANCRMCLVEVANAPKAVPACATPVSDGMVVKTQTERAKEAQKSVMEFLLINHPLDCPICDQGGECELQDVALGYGKDVSRFTERKRVVKDKNIGPLIATDMTRCIHCTRCVRFGQEVAGMREMGATGRGEHVEIGTFVEKSLRSEVAGNIIDLCPVGALTAKPSRFKARAWEMAQHDSIAPHDCLGSNIHIHTRRNDVIRVVPKENESINETWISDRDRFSYEALTSDDRALKPLIKRNGVLDEVSWEEALRFVAEQLKAVKDKHGGESIGALVSPSSTLEEMYLTRKLLGELGSESIDYRLRYPDSKAARHFLSLQKHAISSLAELENMQTTLLIGADVKKQVPIVSLRVRKSTRDGQVYAINPAATDYNFRVKDQLDVDADNYAKDLLSVVKLLAAEKQQKLSAKLSSAVDSVTTNATHEAIAKALLENENTVLVIGELALQHENAEALELLVAKIASLSGAKLLLLPQGANAFGAQIAGATPFSEKGAAKSAAEMLKEGMKAFMLVGVEPEQDTFMGSEALTALEQSDFVVSLSAFSTPEQAKYADAVLPIAAFTETSGTFVNTCGMWQSFGGAVSPKGEARPAWKVLRVLGNLLDISGFDYVSSEEILAEVKQAWEQGEGDIAVDINELELPDVDYQKGGSSHTTGMYAIDALVRRADALTQSLANVEE